MNFKIMRILVMFDLPTETIEDKREYRHFKKVLSENGFVMLQESVYSKLLPSPTAEKTVKRAIYDKKPSSGFVALLSVTENQFQKMEFVTGEWDTNTIISSDRLVII